MLSVPLTKQEASGAHLCLQSRMHFFKKISSLTCYHKKIFNLLSQPSNNKHKKKPLGDYFLNILLPVHHDLPPWTTSIPTPRRSDGIPHDDQVGKILSLSSSILCRTELISRAFKLPETGECRSKPSPEASAEPLSQGKEVPQPSIKLPGSGRCLHSFPGSSDLEAQPEPGFPHSR